MKFYIMIHPMENKKQVEHPKIEMKNEILGLALLDGMSKEFGPLVLMVRILTLLIVIKEKKLLQQGMILGKLNYLNILQ